MGVAAVDKSEFIMPNSAAKGDAIVMTKLLGTQIACNVYQWLTSIPEKWEQIQTHTNKAEVTKFYKTAQILMGTLNLNGARLMKKYRAKACTDITGFGLLGHSNFLAGA